MIQNHLEISSKSKFWIRNVRNWSKSRTESLRKIYVIFQDLSRRIHKGPYGPMRAHKGPKRADMGPYGPQPGPGPNPDWAPTRPGTQHVLLLLCCCCIAAGASLVLYTFVAGILLTPCWCIANLLIVTLLLCCWCVADGSLVFRFWDTCVL